MTLDDARAVCALNARCGLSPMEPASWRRRWESSPFFDDFRGVPIGWVLDKGDGDLAGALASIHVPYEFGGRRLRGCVGSDWGVEPAARGSSLPLLLAFLTQKAVDLCLVSSAAPATSEILTRLKVSRIPAPGYHDPYMWPLRRRIFAAAALRKRAFPAANLVSWPAGAALAIADFLRGGRLGRPGSAVRQIDSFDERFDAFWDRLRQGPKRLRAVRSRAALEWRFREDSDKGRAVIVVREGPGGLSGYAVAPLRQLEFAPEARLCDIADLQTADDDPAAIRDLLLGAAWYARESRRRRA